VLTAPGTLAIGRRAVVREQSRHRSLHAVAVARVNGPPQLRLAHHRAVESEAGGRRRHVADCPLTVENDGDVGAVLNQSAEAPFRPGQGAFGGAVQGRVPAHQERRAVPEAPSDRLDGHEAAVDAGQLDLEMERLLALAVVEHREERGTHRHQRAQVDTDDVRLGSAEQHGAARVRADHPLARVKQQQRIERVLEQLIEQF